MTDARVGAVPGKRTLTEGLPVQRKAAARTPANPPPEPEQAIERAAGSGGAPVAGDIRGKVEGATGADLGGVRVHTGAESQEAASAVGARAYTVGQDVHFASGEYQPGTRGGDHLIAHELAHTVQQAGGATGRQHKLEVSVPGDAAEREADAVADAAITGGTASVTPVDGAAVMRAPDDTGEEPVILAPGALVKAKTAFRLADTAGGSGTVKMIKVGDLLRIESDVGAPKGHAYWAVPMVDASTEELKEGKSQRGVLNGHYVEITSAAPTPAKVPDPVLLTDFDAKFKGVASELRKSPASITLIAEAAAAGVKFGGYAEDGPGKNAWAYTIGDTIYVPKARTDLTLAISDYLFELNNAVRKPQFDKIHEEGAKGSAGKLTAEQFATQKVVLEVEGMLRLGEIWVEMRKGMGDGPELDKYDGEFYRAEYKAFKDGTRSKDDLVQSVLARKYTSGANAGKTVKEFYMGQYKQISGGK